MQRSFDPRNDDVTLVWTSDDVSNNRVATSAHEEMQAYLAERATINLAGMTRATANSLCG